MPPTKTAAGSWYDHPQYYDMAFREDTGLEADFIEAAGRKYCGFPIRRLLEPACGSGRLVVELAARGYRVTGIDLNEPALKYLRQRLARRKVKAKVVHGDMTQFTLPQPVDIAYCFLNSFRHLLSESAARNHLQCVARNLRPGGLYLLGMHLVPPDAHDESIERWVVREGRTQVSTDLRVASTDHRRRVEKMRVSLLVRRGEKLWRFRSEFELRLYNAAQIRRLFAGVPEFELCDVYDFWYEIDEPLELDDEISDTVFVLRKRK